MEDMKIVLKEIVAQRLSAAPDSTAKGELIEELAGNLYCRYADLVAAGVESEDAKARAVDALGDTDELVEYLKSLEPDQPLPGPVPDSEKEDGGQIEEILHNVEDILRGAFRKAKGAFKEAKDAIKVEICDSGDNPGVPEPELAEPDEIEDVEFEELEDMEDPEEGEVSDKGWKVTYQNKGGHTVEIDSDSIKATMKDAMKDIEKVIRDATGAAKDACKAARDAAEKVCEDVSAACTPDAVVEADQPIDAARLIGIDVQTFGGDITVRMTQAPDGDVLVGGDIEDLEVSRSESGVLTIRPVKTETSVFFFGRGIFNSGSSADVVLDLPCREWDFLKLSTTGGDVELTGNCPVEGVYISTVSGDVTVSLPNCTHVDCKTTNGDVEWDGDAAGLHMESISGDLRYRGIAHGVTLKSTSGDVTAEGEFLTAAARTISGDVCLRSSRLPGRIDVGTTSGDIWVDIPDEGPFTARFRSTGGDFTSDFFTGRMGGRSCVFNYQGGGESQYTFASVSGDVEIRKYR